MLHRIRGAARTVLAVGLLISAAGTEAKARQDAPAFDPTTFDIGLEEIASGFDSPVYVTGPDDGSGRLFVVEQPGRVRIVDDGQTLASPFLDITGIVESGGSEQGLLSVAFPEDFAELGVFYVYYTARTDEGVGDNTIARYRVSADDPNLADPGSGEILLQIPDFRVNHNGGQLHFGPDGFLYAGLGDGGGAGDPDENAQNPSTLLGSLLRIDPSVETNPYAIPADNPFASGGEGAPEVWAWGLRNPWRFSFDRETGDLYIGDVGQGEIEEVNRLPAGTPGGTNFGWSIMEGTRCFRADSCDDEGLTLPVAEYTHEFGCSVVGGYVYRGEREPSLEGIYLFADFCSGLIWGMAQDDAGEWLVSEPIQTEFLITSFGEDADGEVYLAAKSGEIFRVTGA
jgi:glucose/arabinose dehydrogenase